jgi:hypothetical protein
MSDRFLKSLLAGVIVGLIVGATAEGGDLVLLHARVFSSPSAVPIEDATIIVRGGRIASVRNAVPAPMPAAPGSTTAEVIYWNISATGAISEGAHPANSSDYLYATAACMLPTGVPMSIYTDEPTEWTNEVHAGWYGQGGKTAEYAAISGMGSGVSALTAAPAGTNYDVLDPYAAYQAYFVTGAVTQTSTQETDNKGTLQIRLWSYQVEPLLL